MIRADMARKSEKNPAVLMGDIIASSAYEDMEALHKGFNAGVRRFQKRHGKEIVSPLTITLGDEFQGLVRDLQTAFRMAHGMRLHFLVEGIACRFVMSNGAVETRINVKEAWNMMGPGLAKARERLGDKQDPSAYRFVCEGAPLLESALNTFGYTLTEIEADWTDTQMDYVSAHFSETEKSYADLAEAFGVSARNVYKVMNAAKMHLYERQLKSIGEVLAHLDGQGKSAR